jgi:hypothetical protein
MGANAVVGIDIDYEVLGQTNGYAFTGRGSFVHPIFGRLNGRGAFAFLAFHLRLHNPQIRRSILINSCPRG